jgi:hypothetical protein
VVTVAAGTTGGAVVDGVGSKLLSSGRADSCLSDMTMEDSEERLKTRKWRTKEQTWRVPWILKWGFWEWSGNTLRERRVRGLGSTLANLAGQLMVLVGDVDLTIERNFSSYQLLL